MLKLKTEIIQTEDEYHLALDRIDELWGAPIQTPEGKELDRLATLVCEYEAKHHSFDSSPTPVVQTIAPVYS